MLPPNHEKMAPDGAGGDSSAAGRLDDTHVCVTVEPAEPLEAAAALTSRYLIPVLARGEVNAGKTGSSCDTKADFT